MVFESNRDINETDVNEKDYLKKSQMHTCVFSLKLFDILLDNLTKSQVLLGNIFEILNNLVEILNQTKSEWVSMKIVCLISFLLSNQILHLFSIKKSDNILGLLQKINNHIKLWFDKELTPYNRTVLIYLYNLLCSFINLMHSTNDVIFCKPSLYGLNCIISC